MENCAFLIKKPANSEAPNDLHWLDCCLSITIKDEE